MMQVKAVPWYGNWVCVVLMCLAVFGCSGGGNGNTSGSDAGDDGGADAASGIDAGDDGGADGASGANGSLVTPDPVIQSAGPADIGFFSSVAFNPTSVNEVWVSGDDGSGLYRSTDGGNTFTLLEGVPPNHSSYALAFDPIQSNTVYAPSHFGRGFLRSTDNGATWSVTQNGLPVEQGEAREVNAMVALDNGELILAIVSGLYRSENGGLDFNRIAAPALNSATAFTALTANASRIVAGSANGHVYLSNDSGATWADLTPADTIGVSDLAVTNNAIYIGYFLGVIARADFNGTITIINNPNSGGFTSGMWSRLAVLSGDSIGTDTLWVGTVAGTKAERGNQLFVSSDGGTSFTQRSQGLDGASIFSLAINPANSEHVVVGTIGEGIFVTRNAGQNWQRSTGPFFASAVLGFAEDPTNNAHWLLSSAESLPGTRGLYETTDSGATWSPVDDLLLDARALQITTNGSALAAIFHVSETGIMRRAPGSTQWLQTLPGVLIEGMSSAPDGDVWAYGDGLYLSQDNGQTWTRRINQKVVGVSFHPTVAGEMIACGSTSVLASVDSFASEGVSLSLNPPGDVTSCAFDANQSSTVLAAAGIGQLFVTNTYQADGQGVTWQELSTPIVASAIRSIVSDVGSDGTWYISSLAADSDFTDASRSGLFSSTDNGESWTQIELAPTGSTLVWELFPSQQASRFYVGMWGGGGLLTVDH